jgi:hypothetical protein
LDIENSCVFLVIRLAARFFSSQTIAACSLSLQPLPRRKPS